MGDFPFSLSLASSAMFDYQRVIRVRRKLFASWLPLFGIMNPPTIKFKMLPAGKPVTNWSTHKATWHVAADFRETEQGEDPTSNCRTFQLETHIADT